MPIETLTGSSVNIGSKRWETPGKGDAEKKRAKLKSIRAASVVVATAVAFEQAMHKVGICVLCLLPCALAVTFFPP